MGENLLFRVPWKLVLHNYFSLFHRFDSFAAKRVILDQHTTSDLLMESTWRCDHVYLSHYRLRCASRPTRFVWVPTEIIRGISIEIVYFVFNNVKHLQDYRTFWEKPYFFTNKTNSLTSLRQYLQRHSTTSCSISRHTSAKSSPWFGS
jgi:hypothetical protein